MTRDPLPADVGPLSFGADTLAGSPVGVLSGITQGLIFAAVWLSIGLATAVVLRRRGHDLRSVIGLAVVLGPLFIPLALEYVRHRDPATRPLELVPPARRPGRRALVVLRGAPEAAADAVPVLRLIDDLGPVVLVSVIDYESAQRGDWDDGKAEAQQRLRRASAFLDEFRPGQVLAPGTLQNGIGLVVTSRDDVVLLVGEDESPGAEKLDAVAGVPVITVPATSGT